MDTPERGITHEQIKQEPGFSAFWSHKGLGGYVLPSQLQHRLSEGLVRVSVSYARSPVPTNKVDRNGQPYAKIVYDGYIDRNHPLHSTPLATDIKQALSEFTVPDPITSEPAVHLPFSSIDAHYDTVGTLQTLLSSTPHDQENEKRLDMLRQSVDYLVSCGIPFDAIGIYGSTPLGLINTDTNTGIKDVDLTVRGLDHAPRIAELAHYSQTQLDPRTRYQEAKGSVKKLTRHSSSRINLCPDANFYIDVRMLRDTDDTNSYPALLTKEDFDTAPHKEVRGTVFIPNGLPSENDCLPSVYYVRTDGGQVYRIVGPNYTDMGTASPGNRVHACGLDLYEDGHDSPHVLYLQTPGTHGMVNYHAHKQMELLTQNSLVVIPNAATQ